MASVEERGRRCQEEGAEGDACDRVQEAGGAEGHGGQGANGPVDVKLWRDRGMAAPRASQLPPRAED